MEGEKCGVSDPVGYTIYDSRYILRYGEITLQNCTLGTLDNVTNSMEHQLKLHEALTSVFTRVRFAHRFADALNVASHLGSRGPSLKGMRDFQADSIQILCTSA